MNQSTNEYESKEILTDNVNDVEKDILTQKSPTQTQSVDNQPTQVSPDQTSHVEHQPTQIQSLLASLIHVHTKVELELPSHLETIHIGKPNEKVPPDIDISGFPHSQVVSRVHAHIIRDDDQFYIEDAGSTNGTYINHTPLPAGNRHHLKSGDRIALGKEDKVSFIFQLKQ